MIIGNLARKSFGGVPRTASSWRVLAAALLLAGLSSHFVLPQSVAQQPAPAETTSQKVQRLSAAVEQVQAQMGAYQKQLQDMQQQLAALQQQLGAEKDATPPSAPQAAVANGSREASESTSSLAEIRERQAVEDSQIATHEQSKVETESKYPLKVTGLVLFNGFVNTRHVDVAPAPTYSLPGGGSTGLSLRQTVLGLDARGPHLFGAASHADVSVDFFGNVSESGYAAGGLLRLRTAHADLNWQNTEAFVELDRPLISPNLPTSLVATAQPEFAWSGNLWTWNPQIGVSQQIALTDSKRLKLQAALIDVTDPPILNTNSTASSISTTERSRWPGTEARIAFAAGGRGAGPEIGVGGYFGPHETVDNLRFNAWAGTVDLRLPVDRHFEITANAYRGQALGGLGGGGYVDYLYQYTGPTEIARGLNDIGGWAQLKSKVGERMEFNEGYGIDNPFVRQIRDGLSVNDNLPYSGLTRNRSIFGNVIYKPSAYLLFSIEYRRLWTNYIYGSTNFSDVIGIGAGYKF